jgi:hypothetical protein
MTTISASTTLNTGYNVTSDTTGTLVFKTGASPTTAMTIDGSQNTTFAGSVTPPQLAGIVGTTTNNNANAGAIGEYISSQVTAGGTGLTSGVASNVTSISLTAGDWDVSGSIFVNQAAGTTLSLVQASINTTSATNQGATTGYCTYLQTTFTTSGGSGIPVPTLRLSLSTTTTVYLVVAATFGVSTAGAGGFLRARRMR